MKRLISGAHIVNENKIFKGFVRIENDLITEIGEGKAESHPGEELIDAYGLYLIPGMIDDQVHFREPGLTHKGEIYTEAKAAVAGGITSYMEMPNTVPNALTQELLQDKYDRASEVSLANYSFFMGASNDNLDEVLKTDPKKVCGVKIFMGASTGNMLVDNRTTLEGIFSGSDMLIATHCEDEQTIRDNSARAKAQWGEDVPIEQHPVIRSAEACYKSSSLAMELATKHNARLHILHISTAKETELFRNDIPMEDKRITAEACIHHLWFTDADYAKKGTHIKWNPAVKSIEDRNAVRQAIIEDRIDIIATDHAPHTLEEKSNKYFSAPSGGPLVQHALPALFDMYHDGVFSLEKIVEKTSHKPARMFDIPDRGFIRVGYKADLALVDLNNGWTVSDENILYKCGWSPFNGHQFKSTVICTFVNGHKAYWKGEFDESQKGKRLAFDR